MKGFKMIRLGLKKKYVEPEKLLGIRIKHKTHERFKMVALHEGTNMSRLLKEFIKEYLKGKPSTKKIMKGIAKDAYKVWDKDCIENYKKKGWKTPQQLSNRFDGFLNKVREELKRAYLSKGMIEKIIEMIQEMEIDR